MHLLSIVFGKADEMDKCFFSLNAYGPKEMFKYIFINTSSNVNGKDNVEVFKKYYKSGDRCFIANNNYYSAPYRYLSSLVCPTQICILTECDIWLTQNTTYFDDASHILKDPEVGMIIGLTRYLTPILDQRIPEFNGYIEHSTEVFGKKESLPWHFIVTLGKYLQGFHKYTRGAIRDTRFQRFMRRKHKRIMVKDLRKTCYHFDDYASFDKYPEYRQFYQPREWSHNHGFNNSCFVEV